MGAVAKSYMRKGFLIHEKMRKYLALYEEAVIHILLCNGSLLEEETILLIFYQCFYAVFAQLSAQFFVKSGPVEEL
jgi:hypothetical protein